MSIWSGISMLLGLVFGYGMVMLIIIAGYRREDRRLYGGHGGYSDWWLSYWILTPLSFAGIVACSALGAP